MTELTYFTINFKRLNTVTETVLKKMWREVAVSVHPDKGGSHEQYLEAYNEYQELHTIISKYHAENGGSYYEFTSDKVEDYDSWDLFFANVHPKIREAFEFIFGLDKVTKVEIIGTWIYADCNDLPTAKYLDTYKILDRPFVWCSRKEKWAWWLSKRTDEYMNYSMDYLRYAIGSKGRSKSAITRQAVTA